MTSHIRAATRDDLPRIKEIRFAVKENILSDRSSIPDDMVFWFMDNAPFYVWEEDNILHGFSAADPREGSIWALFVDPASEGRGIGKALLDQCCDALHRLGHRELKLDTGPGTRADSFYRTQGWAPTGGTTQKGNVILAKTLG